ncbi:MAG: PPC domain-containing protein [Deltaproteobacteria bacterium]|nr:PPC domain-containing protein [Deltaproteobacteria bacterium]
MPSMPGMGMPGMPGMPGAAPGAGAPLTLGGPPQTVQVPAPPETPLAITEAGEYQIDAIGEPMDAELYVYQGDTLVANDRDSGGSSNARLVDFLAPGAYTLRVMEYRARPMTVRLQAQRLPPLPPAGAVTPGAPLQVQAPQGGDVRSACREVTLNIAAPGMYQITASSPGFDAELDLIQNGARLEHDSDSGGERAAKIRRDLQPGAYTLRVWDYQKRAAQITIAVTSG